MLTSEAPPWVTNGSGIPVIGMIPRTMPTFTTSWNRIIDASPAPNSVPNGSFARHPATGEIDGVGFKVFPGRIKGAEEPPTKLFTA